MAKVLVVEDELMMRDLVVRKLAANGFDVKIAADGKEALKIWRAEAPDLVLLDLIMPELNGFEVLKEIRSDKSLGIYNTPVIVFSNLWSKEDILKAQDLKINAYLVKAHSTPDDILQKVNEVLGKHAG